MTDDPPRRWPDDSPEEDFKVHQAQEEDRAKQWIGEQKLRPLTDALESHGMLPGDDQVMTGPLVLPDWWDEIPEPHDQCPWCQRPGVPSPCPECRAARATDVDSAAAWSWWAGLTPAPRRLHIAAAYGTDPWSGSRVTIRMEWTDVDAEGRIRTTYPSYFGCAPAGIFWGAQRRG